MSVREMKGQGCCGNCVNCSSPLCSVIFHIVINKIAYSLSIRLSSSSYVAFHLSLHQKRRRTALARKVCVLRGPCFLW